MKKSLKTGIGFGLTSAIITTIGLMVGLYSSTNSKIAVLGGILTIAVADAFSDALGIHISEEFKNSEGSKHVWESTFYTFFCKFIFSIIFILPVIFFPLKIAIIASIFIGAFLLAYLSYKIAKEAKEKAYKIILEHVGIMFLVIIIANLIGYWVNKYCY